jgi:GTPase KRas
MSENKEIKIAVVGREGVGKSSMDLMFTRNESMDTSYDPSEIEFKKQYTMNEESFLLKIIETSYITEELKSMRDVYINQNEAFILLFSVTDRNSFEDIKIYYTSLCDVVSEKIKKERDQTGLCDGRK